MCPGYLLLYRGFVLPSSLSFEVFTPFFHARNSPTMCKRISSQGQNKLKLKLKKLKRNKEIKEKKKKWVLRKKLGVLIS